MSNEYAVAYLDLYADDLPAVVIAHGDEYRAARQALGEA